jgi:hypothetical protein
LLFNHTTAGLHAMVTQRRFQAGFKLWLVCSIALAAAVVIAVLPSRLLPCHYTAAGLHAMVTKRRFQAGFKLWLACSAAWLLLW